MDINLTTLFYIALAAAALYFIVMTAVDTLRGERDEDRAK